MILTGNETAEELALIKKADMEAKLIAEANEARKSAGSKGKVPAIKEIIGELLSIETIDTKTGELVLIGVQSPDDEVITVSAGVGYWKKVGRPFVEGSIVKFSYEVRIKDVTTYKDSENNTKTHSENGNALDRASKFSASAYQRMLDSVSKESDIATLEAVEVERVGAIAQYLGAYVSKR